LHGLLWGIGNYFLLDHSTDAKGVVFEVSDYVVIGGDKIKAPKGKVVFIGTLQEAAQYIDERKPLHHTAGLYGTATAGDCGSATAGKYGTAIAGKYGTAIAGKYGTAIAGKHGTAIAGYGGTAIAGYGGTATAGDRGIIQIKYYDGRYRILIGYIGENGLKPNVPCVVKDGKFVKK
jgi:hypothetical protein